MTSPISSIEKGIAHIKAGKLIVVTDDKNRENEGDLICASQSITPQKINFMSKYGRGLVCVSLTANRMDQLRLRPMVEDNTSRTRTPFYTSVDAVKGTTTGISSHDRSVTIKTLINDKTKPGHLAKPGHVFPLLMREGGVLVRAGHTEASADFARLAGFEASGVLCEIIDENGRMARMPSLVRFAKKHKLLICTITDLIKFRRKTEKMVELVEQVKLPTVYGTFELYLYKSFYDNNEHVALVMGNPKEFLKTKKPILVRVHSQCLTGDTFSSLRCECGEQLESAMRMIAKCGKGVLLYLRQEGRGIGLLNKIKAYALQDRKKLDTVQANHRLGFGADLREYGIGAQILVDLGVRQMSLLTNNPRKIVSLEGYGLKVVERVPIEMKASSNNIKYLKTKKKKLGHILNLK
ncbi:bifunctional 3,4-dihydroxy-2-butanone-4-phosphate synthase/GTP cyclohydrolase II [PVC group bacterium]|nr:bifunctional 3,4-dihydroxy-2-butanone-4-phosphate synthase/GTP cyclohydrolase II [PVC group bacterium]